MRHYQNWSYPMHELDAAGVARMLPKITPGPVAFATFNEIEGTVAPMDALAVFLKKAQQHGAKLEFPANSPPSK